MIPDTTTEMLLAALGQFDHEHRDSEPWSDWENNQAHKYAIRHDGSLYPVKQIISLATGFPSTEFSGGSGAGQANQYAERYGFEVISLRTKNPTWTRDELILALDFYFLHRDDLPRPTTPETIELSATLNRLGATLFGSRSPTFRNPNGVWLKLMNFRSLDPLYTGDGRVGMQRRGKGDEEVWAEFASSPEKCRRTALAILEGLQELEESAGTTFEPDADNGSEEALEGRVLTRLHKIRERNRKLVDRKKKRRLREAGKLECEACGFDFEVAYGERGSGFIEAHHTKPVSELGNGGTTSLKDLVLLCSNCHRMVHARRPWLGLQELGALVKPRSSGVPMKLPDATRVAGVDGCKAGWFAVFADVETGSLLGWELLEHFSDLIERPNRPLIVAVDIPIGLQSEASTGGRECDRAARRHLGQPRGSSVFPPPTRMALAHTDSHSAAIEANRTSSAAAIGVSRQSFDIFPKIIEVDHLLNQHSQQYIKEVHPELCFWKMNSESPTMHKKKEKSGRLERLDILENVGYGGIVEAFGEFPRSAVNLDDIIDAAAACWTALRIFKGTADRIPSNPEQDDSGLFQEMWV
jgi:5-methylcytosine-specific restriction enzyme A